MAFTTLPFLHLACSASRWYLVCSWILPQFLSLPGSPAYFLLLSYWPFISLLNRLECALAKTHPHSVQEEYLTTADAWSISWLDSALHVKANDNEMKPVLTQTALVLGSKNRKGLPNWDSIFLKNFFFLQNLEEICSHFTWTPQCAHITCAHRPVEHSFTPTNNAIIQTGCLTESLA